MQNQGARVGQCCSAMMRLVVATSLLLASAAHGVPIDLTDATPTVTGATTLHISGISTLGSSYWADFQWNEKTNKFDVSAYGEEGGWEPPRALSGWRGAGSLWVLQKTSRADPQTRRSMK